MHRAVAEDDAAVARSPLPERQQVYGRPPGGVGLADQPQNAEHDAVRPRRYVARGLLQTQGKAITNLLIARAGSLPAELRQLTNLQTLNLYGNALSGVYGARYAP